MHIPSLGREDPLEVGTAAHCSILAQRIPGTEEPGGSIASQSLSRLKRVTRTDARGLCSAPVLSLPFLQITRAWFIQLHQKSQYLVGSIPDPPLHFQNRSGHLKAFLLPVSGEPMEVPESDGQGCLSLFKVKYSRRRGCVLRVYATGAHSF